MGGVGVLAGDGFIRRGGMVLGGIWCACGMECWCCSFQCRPIGTICMTAGRLRRHWSHIYLEYSFLFRDRMDRTYRSRCKECKSIEPSKAINSMRIRENKENKTPELPSLTVGFRFRVYRFLLEEVVVGYSVPSPPRPHQYRSRGCGVPSNPCLAEPPFNLSGYGIIS